MKYIFLLAITGILFTPQIGNAQVSDTDFETLKSQLTAISEYIDTTFRSTPRRALSNTELRDSIKQSVGWFEGAQEVSGHFKYEYLPYDDEYRNDDNIVRQAGALYALGEIARHDPLNTYQTSAIAEKAIGYFESISKEGEWDGTNFRCITNTSASTECKLGATSLALIGILGYLEQNPENYEEHGKLAEDYGSFITAMKKPGEGFRNRFRIGASTQNDAESGFSNGEALLALARYQKAHPESELSETIDNAFEHLSAEPFETTKYLWVMAALKDMQEMWPKKEYDEYARAFTDWRVRGVAPHKNTQNNYCAYAEGIVSAYSVLAGDIPEIELNTLKQEIDFWNAKNDTLQLDVHNTWRVIKTSNGLSLNKLEHPEIAFGGYLTAHDEPTERIDFTQHCMTTNLQTLVDIEKAEL